MSNTIEQKPAITGSATAADVTAVWIDGTTKKATPAQLLGDAVGYASGHADVVTSGTFASSQMPGVRLLSGVADELARFDLGLATDVVLGDIVKQDDDRKFQLVNETPSSSASWCEAPSYTDGEIRVFNGGRASIAVFEWTRIATEEDTIAAYAATGSSVFNTGTDVYLDTPELVTSLQVTGNLATLDVRKCISLEGLLLQNSPNVTSVNASTSTLTTIDCESNPSLTTIDISACAALTDINFNNNALTSLDVSACVALTSLACNTNALTALDVSACVLLTSLDCSNCMLTTLTIGGVSTLNYVICSGNQLDANAVNTILAALDDSAVVGGVIDISDNAAPTAGPPDGITAAANLVDKAWTVNTA